MNIAIDCRYLGMSGIGRYLEETLKHLDFKKNNYTLIGKKEKIDAFKDCNYIYNDSNPFSKSGILKFNKDEINKMDLFYSPNFIIPLGIKIPCITTLHDIIFLDLKLTNKNFIEKSLKKFLLKRCMKKSINVLTVSNFSKERISHYYKKYSSKLLVAYPGVSNVFKNKYESVTKENYILFCGNIKKHKGLRTLLEAYKIVKEKDSSLKLFIVGEGDKFRNKDKDIQSEEFEGVSFTGRISDEELINLERKAIFLIQPSLYEGFGAPPLEALCLGTRPIISDIPVFLEVYKKLPVIFFKAGDANDLAEKILISNPAFDLDEKELKKFDYQTISNTLEILFNQKVSVTTKK